VPRFILLLIVGLAACTPPGQTVSPSELAASVETSQAKPSQSEPSQAESIDGPFQLTFVLPRTSWHSGEAIVGEARLSLIRGAKAQLSGSGTGLVAFRFRDLSGNRLVEPAWTADCKHYLLAAGDPIDSEITKSGGWSEDEPNADFYRAFFADPDLHLPGGDWEITAIASFLEGPSCDGPGHLIETPIRIHVEE
jgi:hypothetical protein